MRRKRGSRLEKNMQKIHIDQAPVNHSPHLNGSDQGLIEELVFQFATQANAGEEQVWHASQKYYGDKIGRKPRTIRRAVRKLRQGGREGILHCYQPKGRAEKGHWQHNVITPGKELAAAIREKAWALLGRDIDAEEEADKIKRGRRDFHGRTKATDIALRQRRKQKKEQKKLKVERIEEINHPNPPPETDLGKEIRGKIDAFQAKHFPPTPRAP